MRFQALLREASRNIISGTTRFATFGVLLACVLSGLVIADSVTISQQVSAANAFREAGGATQILTADGRVDPSACESLSTVPGVTAAGAIRSAPAKITISSLPDAPIPAYDLSPGFAGVISAEEAHPPGVLISRDLANTLGAVSGQTLTTSQGNLSIAATFNYPSDGRRPGFGYAVLSATNDEHPFDECWVSTWPQITNIRSLLLTTLVPGEGSPDDQPRISQLNASLGTTFAGHAAFLQRMTRSAIPLATLVAVGLGSLSVRTRRLQIASALHAGITKEDLLATHLLESAAWVVSSTVIALGTAVTMGASVPTIDQPALLSATTGVPLAGLFGALLGTTLAALAASEKQLFRYFKDR